MKVIGLCGGSGSGKGTVCELFSKLGIPSIDTDRMYHEIISTDSECTMEIAAKFGDTVRAYPGIDRTALRNAVFNSRDDLTTLNTITHKHILAKVREIINSTREADGIIIDAPLLFESGFDKECDATVCVIADDSIRIERIITRDGISRDVAKTRIESQISNDDLVQRCDFWIENNSDREELGKKVKELAIKLFYN
jgi:dephospho-CoA kinase